ncbi:hypothetical protein ACFQ48_04190 [Hymenobacter caeli]|uniref:DUF4345 domain-containing protein n=1 Tax=Hymenobacter caeli TaxID=2735894 RepID=A0ABX2FRU4_9BACT|nr:hypothetical protein [Hymenobacter caeli]NRT19157.1 hypothetical protein [Hymenobacter caeli]
MPSFLRPFIAFCCVLSLGLYGLYAAFGPAVVHPLAPYLLAGLAALTLFGLALTARAMRRDPDNILGAYFGSVALRLVAGLGAVLTYLYNGGAHAGRATYTFLGAFFILYFLFAGFEIWAILTNLRPFSKKQVPEQ